MAADSGYVSTQINENRKATMSVNHEGLVLEDISNLLENESYNDVTIELENGNVEANKVIICARSEYFAEVFKSFNSFKLSDELSSKVTVSSTKEAMEMVIRYLYTGKIEYSDMTFKESLDLLNLLKTMEMSLFETIESFTLNKIKEGAFSTEKLLLMASASDKLKLENIISGILQYLDDNIKEASDLPEVKYLTTSLLEALLTRSESNIEPLNYIYKFHTLVNWLACNQGCQQEIKEKLVNIFKLEHFTCSELSNCVRKSSLYSDSDILDVLGGKLATLEMEKDKMTMLNYKFKTKLQEYIKKPLVKEDSWYLLDIHWFVQLKKYVGIDNPIDEKGEVCEAWNETANPGPVDNTSLLKEDRSDIRDDLTYDVHYALVPDEAWTMLVVRFGLCEGQQALRRKVVECKVDPSSSPASTSSLFVGSSTTSTPSGFSFGSSSQTLPGSSSFASITSSTASSFGGFGLSGMGGAGSLVNGGFQPTFGGNGGGGSGNLAGCAGSGKAEMRCWVEVYPLELRLAENSNLQDVRRRKFSKSDTMQHILAVMRTEFLISPNSEVRVWLSRVSGGHDGIVTTSNTGTVQSCNLYSGQQLVMEVKNSNGRWPRDRY